MHHRGHEQPFMHTLRHLVLTGEQRARIHAIYHSARPRAEVLAKECRSNLDQLMTTPPGDAAFAALLDTAR